MTTEEYASPIKSAEASFQNISPYKKLSPFPSLFIQFARLYSKSVDKRWMLVENETKTAKDSNSGSQTNITPTAVTDDNLKLLLIPSHLLKYLLHQYPLRPAPQVLIKRIEAIVSDTSNQLIDQDEFIKRMEADWIQTQWTGLWRNLIDGASGCQEYYQPISDPKTLSPNKIKTDQPWQTVYVPNGANNQQQPITLDSVMNLPMLLEAIKFYQLPISEVDAVSMMDMIGKGRQTITGRELIETLSKY